MDKKIHALSQQIGKYLLSQSEWITCAESCTGGLLAAYLTDIAGSSAYFDRSFVTYSNQAKHELLGIKRQTLEQWGAVSEQTVYAMAQGALKAAHADIAIAISGIAGPGGGSVNKPVGTVWFSWAHKKGTFLVKKRCFSGNRDEVRQQAVYYALFTLLENFIKTP